MISGVIYKIINNKSDEIYIGSTIQKLSKRYNQHKEKYKKYKNSEEKDFYMSSFDLFNKYGIEECKIVEIKKYDVIDRKHLFLYELLWINKLKSNNKIQPICYLKKE